MKPDRLLGTVVHRNAAPWWSRCALLPYLQRLRSDVATFAAAHEAWQPAVRLFAKAEALLKAEAAAFSLPARDHYERAFARATEALGDSAQAAASAGRALTLEQALAEAEAALGLDRDGSAGSAPAP